MSKFSDYLASQITPQMTLLEKFNLMIKFLQENNYISVFYSQENYNVQTQSYQKEKVNLNGFTLHIGDCIVFSNGYYAFVETIGANNFTIGNVLYFQGQQGVSVVSATISSGHLILTLSDGENIDAGNLKGISSFSINDSQHLIVNYQDGTSQDLGAIFNGDITISGNLTVTETIDGSKVTGNEIVEKMTGYSGGFGSKAGLTITGTYIGVVKTGNKITFVAVGEITRTGDVQYNFASLAGFTIPLTIADKLIPVNNTWLAFDKIYLAEDYANGIEVPVVFDKSSSSSAQWNIYSLDSLTLNTKYYFRLEQTFLLSDNLAD